MNDEPGEFDDKGNAVTACDRCGLPACWQIGTYIPFKTRLHFYCDPCYRRIFPKCPRCRQEHSACRCLFETVSKNA